MAYDEELAQCQREIRRLRGLVRTMDRVKILDAEIETSGSGRLIGDVMTEAWNKALDMDARRISFSFNSHKITIEKEEM